jgi:hypothetical protein
MLLSIMKCRNSVDKIFDLPIAHQYLSKRNIIDVAIELMKSFNFMSLMRVYLRLPMYKNMSWITPKVYRLIHVVRSLQIF